MKAEGRAHQNNRIDSWFKQAQTVYTSANKRQALEELS